MAALVHRPAIKIEESRDWKLARFAVRTGRHVLLYGIPGTGKTTFGRREGAPDVVLTLGMTGETPDYLIIGTDTIIEGSARFRQGLGLRAWDGGGEGRISRLLINEIDKSEGLALEALMHILDEPESAEITIPETGETIRPKAGFQAVCTSNLEDPKELGDALAERLFYKVRIDRPHRDAILSLPVDLQELAHTMSHAGIDEQRRIPIRELRAFAHARTTGVPEEYAAELAFGGRWQDVLTSIRAANKRSWLEAQKELAADQGSDEEVS